MGAIAINGRHVMQSSDENLKRLEDGIQLAIHDGRPGLWLVMATDLGSIHEWISLSASISITFEGEVATVDHGIAISGDPE